MPQQIEHIEYNDEGQISQRMTFREGLLDGPLRIYNEQGLVSQVIHYRAGKTHGATVVLGALGERLFDLPLHWQATLEEGIPSAPQAEPVVPAPREYTSSYQFPPDFSAFTAVQAPAPEPYRPPHPLVPLQPTFQAQGYSLAADAAVMVIEPDAEWLITQADCSYSVRRVDGQLDAKLAIFWGRAMEVVQLKEGMQDGETRIYEEGRVIQSLPFQQNKLHGPLTLYANGKKQTVVHYANGIQDGSMIAYDKEEQEIVIAPYKDGKLHGLMVLYNSGKRQSAISYQAGKEEGKSIVYHTNGKESQVACHHLGKLDGSFEIFYESGQIFKQACYDAGKLTGQMVEYFPSGKVQKVSHYQADKLHGAVCIYNQRGKVIEQHYFDQGKEIPKPLDGMASCRAVEASSPEDESTKKSRWFSLKKKG